MTNNERQADHREKLLLNAGKRLSVTLSREALASLEVIQKSLKERDFPATKKAAIEAALKNYAYRITLSE